MTNDKTIPYYEHRTSVIQVGSSSGYEYSFPMHLHAGPEILRVNKGALKVQLNATEYLVTEGNMVIIFPNVIHAYQSTELYAETDLIICGTDAKNGFPKNIGNHMVEQPVLPISNLHPDVNYMFSALMEEAQNGNQTQLINAYFQIFWLRLLPELTLTSMEQPVFSDLATNLITYVTEHFYEQISLESLSKELGVCRFYLSRIFTQVLHTSFREYINTLRIDHARKLLINTQNQILDIAIECGFQSQQTFNRVFKEICGMTPGEYRKSLLATQK